MNTDAEDFAGIYAAMGEAELLELAQSYSFLTESAQIALRGEFERRQLDPPVLQEEPSQGFRSLVTVQRYRDLSEAVVARSLLESAGIDVFLRDENFVRLEWQISNLLGGIRLQVDSDNAEEAVKILSQPRPDLIQFDDQAEFSQPRCPRCGSAEITYQGASRGAALASLYLFSLPFPATGQTWLCNACEARWEEGDDDSPPPSP